MATQRDDIDSIVESLKDLLAVERSFPKSPDDAALQRAIVSGLVIVRQAQAYCPASDYRLRNIEQRLIALENHSSSPSNLKKLLGPLIRIGVATIASAAIGAPLGAWLVHDEIAKEVVKAAIAASISQTCMEVVQAGQEARTAEPIAPHSADGWSHQSGFAGYFAQPEAEDLAMGLESYPYGDAAGDDDSRAR